MQLDKYVIGLIFISILAVTIGSFYISTLQEYGVTVEEKYQANFNKFNDTYNVVEEISEDIKGASVQEDTDNWDMGNTLKAGLNAIKVVFVQGLPIGLSMIANVAVFVPINNYVIAGLQAILIISILFALVYLYFRFQNK